MNNEVTFTVKILSEGDGNLKIISTDAKEAAQSIDAISESTKRFSGRLLDINQSMMAVQNVMMGIQQLTGQIKAMTDAYANQETQELKLGTIMKQRMDASEQDIASVKKFTAEQQKLGVVGDEVQLAGTQQIATFVNQKSSLEALIPAMNNLLVQRYGLNASEEEAIEIGNLMGKAMQGQTTMLQRVGITFTESQAKIIRFGNEQQRAAMLAQVITDNVGDMNQAFAKTDAGQAKQMSNAFGDIKENVGRALSKLEPFLQGLSELGMSTFAIISIVKGIQGIATAFNIAAFATARDRIATLLDSQAKALLSAANITATGSVTGLRIAMAALDATMTFGVTLAIQALIGFISKLTGATKAETEAEEKANAASEKAKQRREQEGWAISQSRAELELTTMQLKNFKGSKEKEMQMVQQCNAKYGEAMGVYQSVAEWYKVLTANSGIYCQQLVNEARIREEANQAARVQEKLDLLKSGKSTPKYRHDTLDNEVQVVNPEYTKDVTNYTNALTTLNANIKNHMAENSRLTEQMRNHIDQANYTKMSYDTLGKAIDAQKAKVEGLIGVNDKEAAKEASVLKQMEKRQSMLSKEYGLSGNSVKSSSPNKEKYDGSHLAANAKSYKELSNNIEYYQNALEATDASHRKTIKRLTELISKTKESQRAIKDLEVEYATPTAPKTLEEYDAAISRQEDLRKRATINDIGNIDKEIEHLKNLRSVLEGGSAPIKTAGEVKNYAEMDAAIGRWQAKLQSANAELRPAIAQEIRQLNDLREKWEQIDNEASRPAEADKLNTLKALDSAITYITQQMQTANASEIAELQKELNLYQRKRDMLRDVSGLYLYDESGLSGLSGLSGKELTIRLREIGIEGIEKKVQGLKKLLANVNQGGNEGNEIKKQIAQWARYESTLKKSQITFKGTWSNIKGIGDGIKGLTTALKSNGSAWDKMTGIVDAGIAIFEGISSLIQIIKVLTAATATEQATEAATEAASNAVLTKSVSALAAAKIFASYAPTALLGGTALAVKDIALMKTTISAMALANGGVLYGPTMALMGEYPGASSNPEVVAPLDKLKSLLGDSGGGHLTVELKSKLRGRDIVLSSKREIYRRSRS